ncbi:hypothetical protein [Pseudogemmobacter blasticus]|uniref:Uncharacterized protein n=1 Tax=Fuscovulum blasticum DSM 2131 TaxID=1188250 RepID=A0A2T4JDJ7_FUSBL|nr:hypothetical protein [Fuscovulum blasticum]PTE15995.1 hypothetical protein C5F44_02860 [Fuscovulum blasticum DSM 2131]
MSDDKFKFTELHLGTPHDNIAAAISIIQTQIMATYSDVDSQTMFGLFHCKTDHLLAAVSLLVPLLGPVEALRWEGRG